MIPTNPRIGLGDVGPDGRVAIFDTYSQRWHRKYPIDAKEMIRAGTGDLSGPTVIAVKEGEEDRLICAAEAPNYRREGWKTKRATPNALKARGAPTRPRSERREKIDNYDFSAHGVDELRILAGAAGIAGCEGLQRRQLLAALDGKELTGYMHEKLSTFRSGEGEEEEEEVMIDATTGAIQLADEHGIDLGDVIGTGQNGRITKSDVEGFLEDQSSETEDDDDEDEEDDDE